MRHRHCWTHSLVIGVAACTVLAAAAASAGQAAAQAYPSRPITIIVAFPAGGPSDTPARMLAERMRASLGQPVIVENVAGGSGTIGTGQVARAAGDGYTLVLGNAATHVINSALPDAPIRRRERFCAGLAAFDQLAGDRRKEDAAGEQPERVDRLAEGESGQGDVRDQRGRQYCAPFRRPLSEGNRHAFSVSCPIAASRRPCRTLSRARST